MWNAHQIDHSLVRKLFKTSRIAIYDSTTGVKHRMALRNIGTLAPNQHVHHAFFIICSPARIADVPNAFHMYILIRASDFWRTVTNSPINKMFSPTYSIALEAAIAKSHTHPCPSSTAQLQMVRRTSSLVIPLLSINFANGGPSSVEISINKSLRLRMTCITRKPSLVT